jgi:hypothetical protein
MTNADWTHLLRRIPECEHSKLVFVLRNGTEMCVEIVFRFEEAYAVVRGRFAGSTDELRGFFVPYDQILCLRLDRAVRAEDMQEIFANDPIPAGRKSGSLEMPLVPPSERPTPTVPADPAAASKLLLERIRAVRASSAKFPSHSG